MPDGNALFGVFDGHGGKEVSIFVKARFTEELQKLDSYKSKDYTKALKDAFKKIDDILLTDEGNNALKEIQARDGQQDPFSGAMGGGETIANFTGCTATVVLITKTDFYCANAGDSRSVLGRASGSEMCCPLSEDHKPDNPDEKARIEKAGGFVEENRVNGSLNLSRSMGDFEYKSKANLPFDEQMVIVDPEVKKVARTKNDQFLILACDGIWDCKTSEEGVEDIREALQKRKKTEPISKLIEDLFERICATDIISSAGIGTDNMTCIVVEFQKK